MLLAHKAEVNAKNKDGNTPLHLAALNDHVDVAELLLAAKADVNARNELGNTPLKTAAQKSTRSWWTGCASTTGTDRRSFELSGCAGASLIFTRTERENPAGNSLRRPYSSRFVLCRRATIWESAAMRGRRAGLGSCLVV